MVLPKPVIDKKERKMEERIKKIGRRDLLKNAFWLVLAGAGGAALAGREISAQEEKARIFRVVQPENPSHPSQLEPLSLPEKILRGLEGSNWVIVWDQVYEGRATWPDGTEREGVFRLSEPTPVDPDAQDIIYYFDEEAKKTHELWLITQKQWEARQNQQ